MTNQIIAQRESGVVSVTFNRPEKRNAFTLDMYRRLGEVLGELDADETVRCIVLQGGGTEAFCAGSDIGEFGGNRTGAEQAQAYAKIANGATDRLRDCRHPTIAKILGLCIGGGLEIASLCDVRICSADSRFGIPINRLGLTVDYPELQLLVDLVGRRIALEILIEGRIFDAEEALQKQLVSRIVAREALDDEVSGAAERIARAAPLVNRWHKAFVARLADPRPLTDNDRQEPYQCYATEDYRIGISAFIEKRVPEFVGR